MRIASLASAVSLFCVVFASGCTLYFGGGEGDDEVCINTRPAYGDAPIDTQVRDPYSGECYGGGGGGGGGCYYDDDCDVVCEDYGTPPPTTDEDVPPDDDDGTDIGGNGEEPDATPPIPSGAQCYSDCDALDEQTCQRTTGCQVAYETKYDGTYGTGFLGCWATDVTSPDAAGSCPALDAYACSTRDDCTMNYDATEYPYKTDAPYYTGREFSYCGTEGGGSCAATDCGPGYHCVDSCYETTTDPSSGMDTACVATCVPDGQSCETVECGPGYECIDYCDTGANGGLWCNPTCTPVTSCEALVTQQACDARGDCTSVFNGTNCTCYDNGYCECETLTWDRCETWGANGMND